MIRKRAEHTVRGSDLSERKYFYVPSLSANTLIYKGMLSADQIETMFPDVDGPARRVSAGSGPPALLDQYVPVLAARPPLPLHRPQRRDQHAARQHQLDAGARGPLPLAPPRRRPQANPAHRGRGRQRLRRLRQRARVPRDGGSAPAPGRADDDPRGVERARVHGGGAAGVLRVPRLPHGALGRPRVHRVHRRHRDRRRARPKRAAPLALLRHQGRAWS